LLATTLKSLLHWEKDDIERHLIHEDFVNEARREVMMMMMFGIVFIKEISVFPPDELVFASKITIFCST